MNERAVTGQSITLKLAVEELEAIYQALNEVCNGLSVVDFDARMGVSLDDARQLMTQIRESLERAQAVLVRGE